MVVCGLWQEGSDGGAGSEGGNEGEGSVEQEKGALFFGGGGGWGWWIGRRGARHACV